MNSENGSRTTEQKGHFGMKMMEIDTGILVAVEDSSRTYVKIYRPPVNNPPTGFSSSNVYFYIQNAMPTTANTTLTTTVTNPTGSPGFSATQAESAPNGSFTNTGSTPSSSNSLWVDSSGTWAFQWNVTGTGTSATGTVVWWNTSTNMISPSSGSVSNNTNVSSSATYRSIDTLT
jgi:hypothetical protein